MERKQLSHGKVEKRLISKTVLSLFCVRISRTEISMPPEILQYLLIVCVFWVMALYHQGGWMNGYRVVYKIFYYPCNDFGINGYIPFFHSWFS